MKPNTKAKTRQCECATDPVGCANRSGRARYVCIHCERDLSLEYVMIMEVLMKLEEK